MPTVCDMLFGQANTYVLCAEDATSCTFFNLPLKTTCHSVCGNFGTSCIDAYDQDGGNKCVLTMHLGCAWDMYNDYICICSKKCGVNAPCPGGKKCNMSGMCG